MLTELRTEINDALKAGENMPAGFTTYEYVAEGVTPPCGVVVPAQSYIRKPGPQYPDIPFGHVGVGIDVLLLTTREAAKTEAALADQIIEASLRALRKYRIIGVSQPGVVTLSGSKFIGSVLSIEEITEEP